ncbi:hypothetical protein [Shewanella gelidii]|uniref:Uncharacterized protein n=1 Tax=Shewanella gelidii TaxID=1642821 RepID=A0A917JLN7_9GAMM|nr:hypothetical protein [Shewanella gelidii]MCL1097005.1 hypothetical protein [Shewanella gelidii]GGI71861.1 hypothetical protein GCM10009332_06530 [Shewanella gelidii]
MNPQTLLRFLPSKALAGLHLTQIVMDEMPESFDVIVARHPRFSDEPLQKGVISQLEEHHID